MGKEIITRKQLKQINSHYENLKLEIEKGPNLYTDLSPAMYNKAALWGMRDAGSAASGLPVIKMLLNEGIAVSIFADGSARDMLEKENLGLHKVGYSSSYFLNRLLRNLEKDLIVCGHSVKPDIEQFLTYCSKLALYRLEKPIKSVWYEDMPPFLGFYKKELAAEGRLMIPDKVFCFSETSAKQEVGYIPQFKDRAVVTGNPAFDRFADIDTMDIRHKIRQGLGIRDDEVWLVWMATKTRATFESCRDYIDGIKGLGLEHYRFSARIHPAEAKNPEVKKEYDLLLATIGEHALDTTGYPTDDIGIAADIVGGDTSTAIFEATLNDIRTVTLLIPENMVLRDEWVNAFPPDPAIVLDGTSPVIRNRMDVKDILQKVVLDSETQEALRQKRLVWRSVIGGSTQRFRDRLMEIMGRS